MRLGRRSLRVASLLSVRKILKEKNAPLSDIQQIDQKLRQLGVDPAAPPPSALQQSSAGPTQGTLGAKRRLPFATEEVQTPVPEKVEGPDTNGHSAVLSEGGPTVGAHAPSASLKAPPSDGQEGEDPSARV